MPNDKATRRKREEMDALVMAWDNQCASEITKVKSYKPYYFFSGSFVEWFANTHPNEAIPSFRTFHLSLLRLTRTKRIPWLCHEFVYMRTRTYRYERIKHGAVVPPRGSTRLWFYEGNQLNTEDVEAWLNELGWADIDAPDRQLFFKLSFHPPE